MKQITRKQKGVGTKGMTNAHKMLPYSIPNMGSLGGFAQYLTYKTENVGKRVIRIDESHTSQQLYMCRKRMKRVFSERVMTYDCENRIGRDLTSLINILECLVHQNQYFDFLSHQPSMTEESFRNRWDLLRKTVPSPQVVVDGELVVNGRVGVEICTP